VQNKKMKKAVILTTTLLCSSMPALACAQTPTTNLVNIAQANHNQNCPKDLPSALFDTKKLIDYQIKWQVQQGLISSAEHASNSDQSALAHLVESAKTAQNISFKMTQSGCEFINEELVIDLPISTIEKNGKFCNDCLIKGLKGLKPYFLEDRGRLFFGGVDTLNHYIKTQKIRVKYAYIDPNGGEMAHSITIDQMQKIPSENIWRIQLTVSIGPL
jgi:hypothetical protein